MGCLIDGLVGIEEFEHTLCRRIGFLQVVVYSYNRLHGRNEACK